MKEYTAFLVPQFNLPVRDPITKAIIAPEGAVKPLSGKEGRYWRRRINEGCVKIKDKKIIKNIKSKYRKTRKEE
jgi:hypothetical protein